MSQSITETPFVLREDSQGVATLTLNRPDHYNALSEEMLAALQAQLEAVDQDDSIRVVVLAARGRAFCAGHDLKQMRQTPDQTYYETLFQQCSQMMLTVTTLSKPVIARVQGLATAAGCQLVGTCDLAVASNDATFAVSGINVGLFCSTPSVALSRNVSRKTAFEMLMTGDFIDAREAETRGLINRAVPPDKLDAAVENLATTIKRKSVSAVRIGKQMFYEQLEKPLSSAYEYAGRVMAANMMSQDAQEGIDAFIEKRVPEWKDH